MNFTLKGLKMISIHNNGGRGSSDKEYYVQNVDMMYGIIKSVNVAILYLDALRYREMTKTCKSGRNRECGEEHRDIKVDKTERKMIVLMCMPM